MEFIAHRINSVINLKELPSHVGVEIDLRDYNNDLIIEHDPFKKGDFFKNYLKSYTHGTIILNIKSERIEYRIIDELKKYKICNYFFLDSSFPMIKSLIDFGERNIALRFSEYECMDTLVKMKGKVNWIWIDCFTTLPINYEIYKELKNCGYKLCLVSPELQGQPEKIINYRNYLERNDIQIDAVCSKFSNYSLWMD